MKKKNTFTENDINKLLGVLKIGKENAKTACTIATEIGYPTTHNQPKTRKLIREAIKQGH